MIKCALYNGRIYNTKDDIVGSIFSWELLSVIFFPKTENFLSMWGCSVCGCVGGYGISLPCKNFLKFWKLTYNMKWCIVVIVWEQNWVNSQYCGANTNTDEPNFLFLHCKSTNRDFHWYMNVYMYTCMYIRIKISFHIQSSWKDISSTCLVCGLVFIAWVTTHSPATNSWLAR